MHKWNVTDNPWPAHDTLLSHVRKPGRGLHVDCWLISVVLSRNDGRSHRLDLL